MWDESHPSEQLRARSQRHGRALLSSTLIRPFNYRACGATWRRVARRCGRTRRSASGCCCRRRQRSPASTSCRLVWRASGPGAGAALMCATLSLEAASPLRVPVSNLQPYCRGIGHKVLFIRCHGTSCCPCTQAVHYAHSGVPCCVHRSWSGRRRCCRRARRSPAAPQQTCAPACRWRRLTRAPPDHPHHAVCQLEFSWASLKLQGQLHCNHCCAGA